MNQKDKEKVMNLLQTFLRDNDGSRVTQWNGTALMQAMNSTLDEIIEQDNPVSPVKEPAEG